MTETLEIANLILGIIGTITGSIAIIIHLFRLKRESPHLEARVLKCEHSFTVSKSQIKTISFWAKFQIRNLGDRGTSVNDIDLTFEGNGKEYCLKKKYFRGARSEEESERRWISAHDVTDIEADFYEPFEGNEQEQINCTFTIYHTHNAEKVRAVSQKRK